MPDLLRILLNPSGSVSKITVNLLQTRRLNATNLENSLEITLIHQPSSQFL